MRAETIAEIKSPDEFFSKEGVSQLMQYQKEILEQKKRDEKDKIEYFKAYFTQYMQAKKDKL